MSSISENNDGHIVVEGDERSLTISPYEVVLDDGTTISHESRGGTLASVWATQLGPISVEVMHLGDGPEGGELVASITAVNEDGGVLASYVTVGALWTDAAPGTVPASWPVAVDLALGLVGDSTTLLSPDITKDDLETLHQRLLGALHG
ncbi:hypothetical protein [Aeromicrobium chenweiae]|uniref:Uncharacterized protein n=1 Tax=Aeromicrobium chenweiae TaxID=2079793 RepID=A0A2S0WKG2_9ACTN|nr:hypothetical protein [Aeromicrobium chenweiae]AWB91772.1 hypothetical protein C3E78_05880 [Aeromicrobium chenweiae]TGN32615.1 hypothetical protein E4L97_07840 [Aeromicrobium chenweiae]